MIKYVITAIKTSGMRELAFDNNHYNIHTKKEANKKLKLLLKNNSSERIEELVGIDLEVRPVECYEGGDAKQRYFD